MALIKNAAAAAPKTETAAAPAPPVETAATVETAAAPPVEEKAVATTARPAGELAAASAGKFFLADPEILEIVQDAGYGTFTSVVATSGTFKLAQVNTPIGNEFTFQPIAERIKKVCSPNSNEDEAKEYFAAAYEGELTNNGLTIEEALAEAKAAGYLKADIKEYMDVFVYVVDCPTKPEFNGEIFTLQLAPMSKMQWISFKKGLQVKLRLGTVKIDETQPLAFVAVATPETSKANKDYTRYGFRLAA